MCIEASVSRQRKISFRWIPNVTHWLCKVNQFDYCWVAIFAFDEDDAEKFAPGFLRSTKSKTRFYPNRSLQIFRRLVTFSWIRWIRLCKERGQNKSFCSHRWIFFVFPTQQKTLFTSCFRSKENILLCLRKEILAQLIWFGKWILRCINLIYCLRVAYWQDLLPFNKPDCILKIRFETSLTCLRLFSTLVSHDCDVNWVRIILWASFIRLRLDSISFVVMIHNLWGFRWRKYQEMWMNRGGSKTENFSVKTSVQDYSLIKKEFWRFQTIEDKNKNHFVGNHTKLPFNNDGITEGF